MFLVVRNLNTRQTQMTNFLKISASAQISEIDNNKTMQAEDELAKKIYMIIEHFKQDDPVGLPDGLLPVPDPAVNIMKNW
jgi:hypothetical protein